MFPCGVGAFVLVPFLVPLMVQQTNTAGYNNNNNSNIGDAPPTAAAPPQPERHQQRQQRQQQQNEKSTTKEDKMFISCRALNKKNKRTRRRWKKLRDAARTAALAIASDNGRDAHVEHAKYNFSESNDMEMDNQTKDVKMSEGIEPAPSPTFSGNQEHHPRPKTTDVYPLLEQPPS